MQSNKTIIEFKNIVKTYGVGDAQTYALNGVNLSIKEGEFVAIMGSSGSGKSTLLKSLYGALKPKQGSLIVGGVELARVSRSKLNFLRRHIGIVFQDYKDVNVFPQDKVLVCL